MKSYVRALALVAVIALTSRPVVADPWKLDWVVDLTMTQGTYTDNWDGSETGSLAWTLNSNTVAEKAFSRFFNKNTLILAYGVSYNQDADTKGWGSGDKTSDKIDLESTFRWMTGRWAEPIFAFRGISQFLDETNPAEDLWVNPTNLTESVGVTHLFFKEETREWQTRVGVAAKQLIDRNTLLDPMDPFAGRETQVEYQEGAELVNDIKLPLAEDRIIWTSKLSVFQALVDSDADDVKGTPQEDYWKYPDVNFENWFVSNITKHIAVNLYVQLLYDRQIDRDARFKQTLSFGLTYRLAGKAEEAAE
jgi:hypothetical protein